MPLRSGRILPAILTIMIALFSIAATSVHATAPQKSRRGKHKPTPTPTPTPLKIGFSIDSLKVERWQTDLDSCQTRAQQIGAEVISADAEGDDDLQLKQVQELVQKGIKVLILVPHDSSKASRLVDVATAAHVKVISYDRMALNSDIDLFVGFDPYAIGRMQADFLVKLAPKGNYVMIAGSPSDDNARILHDEQKKVLQPYIDRGDIKIVADSFTKDWQPSEAYLHMVEALDSAKSNVTAVLSSNDGMAGGVIQALEEQKLAGKVFVSGQDADLAAMVRICQGKQSMTIYKPIPKEGAAAAEAAVALVKGEEIKTNGVLDNGKKRVPAIMLDPVVVTKENIKATVIKDGFQKLDSIQQALPQEQWPN